QISGLSVSSTQIGQPDSSERRKTISYSTAAAPAWPNTSAEAPSKLPSDTSPWRGKRNEATIELARRITTNMRNTISASTTWTATVIWQQHHTRSIVPPGAGSRADRAEVRLRKAAHNLEDVTLRGSVLALNVSDGV